MEKTGSIFSKIAVFQSALKMQALIIIVLVGISGCASLTKPGAPFYGMAQKNRLDDARTLLQQGKTAEATQMLTEICKEPEIPGVTDEALFRLSILRLASNPKNDVVEQSRNDFQRIIKTFPASSWVPLASILDGFLASTEDKLQEGKDVNDLNLALAKENRELKNRNIDLKEQNRALSKTEKSLKEAISSLARENAELRKNVEKLKTLDLDLEKGLKQ